MPYLDNIHYTTHALEQMDKRGLSQSTIEGILANGEVIEEYETDEEARYLLHWKMQIKVRTKPEGEWNYEYDHFHVVAADQSAGRTIVITAYKPANQPERWDDDFKTRLD